VEGAGLRAPASRRAHVMPLGRWAAGPLYAPEARADVKRRVGTPELERGSASRDCPELPSAPADDTLPGTCRMALS